MRLGAAAVLAAALVAAGCGGDGDDGSDLAARADPICARANVAISELSEPRSLEQLLRYVDEASAIIRERRDDLGALDAGDDEEAWRAYLAANDRAIEALVDLRESTVTGRGGEEAIRTFEAAEAEARRLADELGLSECATAPPQPADEEEDEPGTGAGTTTAEPASWAARADEICGEAQARIDALPQPTDPITAAAQVGQVSGIAKEEIAALRDLEPPRDQAARVQRFLDALGRGVDSLDRLAQAMTDQDEDAVDRFIEEGEKAANEAQAEADALGLTVCGRA